MKKKSILAALVLLALLEAWWIFDPLKPEPLKKLDLVDFPPRWANKVTRAPVRLQLGSHHYEVAVEYFFLQPVKGSVFSMVAAWPSMLSYMEGQLIAKKNQDKSFRGMTDSIGIALIPTDGRVNESYKVWYEDRQKIMDTVGKGDWPIVRLDDLGLYKMTSPGQEYYWPIDPAVRTPLQGNPYLFYCDIGSESNLRLTCIGSYQINQEVSVQVNFYKVHLKDWKPMFYKVQEFIKSIEREQP